MMNFIRNQAQSLFVKLIFGIIIIVFVFYFGFSSMRGRSNTILAYVNGRPISITAFSRSYKRALEALHRQSNIDADELKKLDFKRQVLDKMITEELLQEEAASLGLTSSKEDIRQEIAKIPAFQNENQQFDQQLYRHIIRAEHMGVADFEQEIKTMLVRRKLMDYVALSVLPSSLGLEQTARDFFTFQREERKISYLLLPAMEPAIMSIPTTDAVEVYYKNHLNEFKLPIRISLEYLEFIPEILADHNAVSEQDIKDFYEKNAAKTYTQKERIKARNIMLIAEQNATAMSDDKVKARINAIHQRLAKGENFADVARNISEDESSTEDGNLGWIERGQTVEPFEKVAFNLPLNKLSDPVRTVFGWHLILVDSHEAEQCIPLDQVKASIAQTLAEEQATDQVTKLLDQAIELQMAGADLTKISQELGLPLSKQLTISRDEVPIKLPGLTPKAVDMLFTMLAGETTDTPLPIIHGFLLATVKEVKPEETLPLETVQSDIVHKLQEETAMAQTIRKAQELLEAAQKNNLPQLYQAQFKDSPSFGRQGIIQDLGQNIALAEAAFRANPGDWLPAVYPTDKGALIARLTECILPTNEQWNTEKNVWHQIIDQQRKHEVVEAFLNSLREKVKIELVNPKVLE
ncbi:peptidyl-prolyl cis-trans isomerase D [Desulfovibrionales bacterium]